MTNQVAVQAGVSEQAVQLAREAYKVLPGALANRWGGNAPVEGALEHLREAAIPLGDRYPGFRSLDPRRVDEALRACPDSGPMVEGLKWIGRRLRPDFSPEVAAHWCAGVVVGLADFPPGVALRAIQRARSSVLEFPGQVHGEVVRLAEEEAERLRLARRRLVAMQEEIARASQPALPAPEPERLLDERERDEANLLFRRVGLRSRYWPDGSFREIGDGEADPCPEAASG